MPHQAPNQGRHLPSMSVIRPRRCVPLEAAQRKADRPPSRAVTALRPWNAETAAVEGNMDFLEEVERGQAVYVMCYTDGAPTELLFAGYSYD